MPIKETPKALEFTYTPDDMEDRIYKITYDSVNKFQIQVEGNGGEMICPVSLFEEVVEFLQKKGVLTPKNAYQSSAIISNQPLPVPEVTRAGEVSDGESIMPTSVVDPLASFDISTTTTPTTTPMVVPTPVSAPTHASTGPVIHSGSNPEIDSRPVIRTRVNRTDPLSAEKEAAVIRGSGAGPNFRRKVE